MATNSVNEFLQHLRRLEQARDGEGLSDRELLAGFVQGRDTAALETLIRRHGPTVWGVCRRLLSNQHDAEDAFQASFLVFVRKAASIRRPELLANWLYGVANRTARNARQMAARRQARERQVIDMPEPSVAPERPEPDLQPLLDDELSRLPHKYRVVLVLCDLQGKTRAEVARQLGLAEGTVASRVARARARLARRLASRGVAVSSAAVAAWVAQQAASATVPPAVLSVTIKNTALLAMGHVIPAGAISSQVSAITEGVLKAMLITKVKTVIGSLIVAGTILGGGLFAHHMMAAQRPDPDKQSSKSSASDVSSRPVWGSSASEEPKDRSFKIEDKAGVHAAVVSPDGKVLAVGTTTGKIYLLDPVTGEKKHPTIELTGAPKVQPVGVAWTPDGKYLAAATGGAGDKTLRVWEIGNAKETHVITGPDVVYGVAISPDGKRAVTAGGDNFVRVWDIAKGEEITKLDGHTKIAIRVIFSPDGNLVASGSQDQTVRIWDPKAGKELRKLEHGDAVEGLAFSPDGTQLATIGLDGKNRLVLWDVKAGKEIREMKGGRCVAFSPSGKLLAYGGDDKLVHLWDVGAAKEVATFTGHTNSVSSVSFTPDGRAVISAGAGDDTVRVWVVPAEKDKPR